MQRLLLTTFTFFLSLQAVHGYIGEDLWLDLYSKIDTGIYSLRKQLVEKRLEGSAEKVNRLLGKICNNPASVTWPDYCFVEGYDFTSSELASLGEWNLGTIYAHLKDEFTEQSDTITIQKLSHTLSAYYATILKEVSDTQAKLQEIGSIGLFTDGSIDNSSYDLAYDLEQIHMVIFSRDIPYEGTENLGSFSVADMLTDRFQEKEDLQSSLLLGSGTTAPPLSFGNLSWPTSLGTLNTPYCATGSSFSNIDSSLFRDISTQMAFGSNNRTVAGGKDNSFLPEHWAKASENVSGGGLYDTFPCSNFFCITVEFMSYSQNLLGGGKSDSIEGILDKNRDIVTKYAPNSFVQAGHTKGFFESILKSVDLPSMLHIGVVVTSLPPPILNLHPKDTPRGADANTGEDADFKEILAWVFQEGGLTYKTQNSLEQDFSDLTIVNSAGLTTDQATKKFSARVPGAASYETTKSSLIKKEYYDSFSNDLLELRGFTKTFTDHIESLNSLIKGLNEIPQEG